jgi:hypothetical protein
MSLPNTGLGPSAEQGARALTPLAAFASGKSASAYFRARDAQGHEYIADSRDQLPEALRAQAERIEVVPVETIGGSESSWLSGHIAWPSFALGFGLAVLVALVVRGTRRGYGPFIKVGLLMALVVAAGSVYLGWIRRTTGQSGSVLATPSALIQDAQRAVDKMNDRNRSQEQLLRQIDEEGRR